MEGNIQGVRYSCLDGFKTAKSVTLRYEIRYHGSDYWLILEGGPTGYESMRPFIGKAFNDFKARKPWTACFGTEGKWDRLDILAEEMLRVTEEWEKRRNL